MVADVARLNLGTLLLRAGLLAGAESCAGGDVVNVLNHAVRDVVLLG